MLLNLWNVQSGLCMMAQLQELNHFFFFFLLSPRSTIQVMMKLHIIHNKASQDEGFSNDKDKTGFTLS